MREEVVRFGPGDGLVGVLALPEPHPASRVTSPLVLLNAGMLHRVGPSRLYVQLARRLAGSGRACLRFDHSGIGDSPARQGRGRFEVYALEEVRAAIDLLQGRLGVQGVLVGGICSAGTTAFRLALDDPRVRGVLCINGGILRDDLLTQDLRYSLAQTHVRLYRRRLLSLRSWLRLLSGRSDLKRIVETLRRRFRSPAERGAASSRAERCAQTLRAELEVLEERDASLLLLLSEGSSELDLQTLVFGPRAGAGDLPPCAEVELLAGTDHVFTPRWSQEYLLQRVEAWCETVSEPGQ